MTKRDRQRQVRCTSSREARELFSLPYPYSRQAWKPIHRISNSYSDIALSPLHKTIDLGHGLLKSVQTVESNRLTVSCLTAGPGSVRTPCGATRGRISGPLMREWFYSLCPQSERIVSCSFQKLKYVGLLNDSHHSRRTSRPRRSAGHSSMSIGGECFYPSINTDEWWHARGVHECHITNIHARLTILPS